MQKRRHEDLDWDDGEIQADEYLDVDRFVEDMQRKDRKRHRLSARHRLERRNEERVLRRHLDDWED